MICANRLFRQIGSAVICLVLSGAAFTGCPGDSIVVDSTASELEYGLIRGLETVDDVLPWYDEVADAVTNEDYRPMDKPLELLLSKYAYPAEDGYIDAVLWIDHGPDDTVPGRLEAAILDAGGNVLEIAEIEEPPGHQLFFSLAIPEELAGAAGKVELRWIDGEGTESVVSRAFEVKEPEEVAHSGSIDISLPNDTGAVQRGVSFTVGVPFPRGVLSSADNVRLLDEEGIEVPVDVKETARWSRYGSIKWLLCDFTADVQGGGRGLILEYGPDVSRADSTDGIVVEEKDTGFPNVRAGALEVRDDGVFFDVTGEGDFRRVLEADAILGGYVEHEDGRVYRMQPDQAPGIEVEGSNRLILKTSGYYREPETGREFCKYNTRYTFHRDSPILRIAHTWIYTGDSNTDRIADMGWNFRLADDQAPDGFLRSFEHAELEPGRYILQHDYNLYDFVGEDGEVHSDVEGRLPGVMSSSDGEVRFSVGIRDFWQNFPSELGADEGKLMFHNWPRHGRAPRHSPATADDAIRLWFAHEGEVMDLSLPEEFAQDPIWRLLHRGIEYQKTWEEGRPEHVNAQGVARTEEMWLHFSSAQRNVEDMSGVMHGLNKETLRAVVDPVWVAASGAFYEIHHRDVENYPEHERVFEEIALAPARWTERVGLYGMWLYGDTMFVPYLWKESARIYRNLRKSHHGWPYSWVPYARSGDSRLLRFAHAATRQMYDANMCHYATQQVEEVTGSQRFRRRGAWFNDPLPWAGRNRGPVTRSYQAKSDYFWHAYYLTGDRRALDVVKMLWGEEMKVHEHLSNRGAISNVRRPSHTLLKGAIEMYEAAHDPWHLVFAHKIAKFHKERYTDPDANYHGHKWESDEWAFLRFTGCPEWREDVCMAYAEHFSAPEDRRWAAQDRIDPKALGWYITGDEYYLRRIAHELDWVLQATYEGEPEYYRGFHLRSGTGGSAALYTSWYLQHFPVALAVLEDAGREPEPIPNRFYQGAENTVELDEGYLLEMPLVAFRKEKEREIPIHLEISRGDSRWSGSYTGRYRLYAPDGEVFMEGEWDMTQFDEHVVVPADAPEGTYRIETKAEVARLPSSRWRHRFLQGLKIPITPPGTPEVMVPDKPILGLAVNEAQYWFKLPPGEDRLEVKFPVHPPHVMGSVSEVQRMSVWNGYEEKLWDKNTARIGWDEWAKEIIPAVLDVPETQRGNLWRITLPGRSGGAEFVSEIKPVFSVSPDRWFDPDSP